ncbi:MAG: SUMF1/EgtB/PvdO family nonheme iron enzyme [Desulfobacteraceae bacterium]|jgi:formylglycine-generating enzyme required for sulfatase activity
MAGWICRSLALVLLIACTAHGEGIQIRTLAGQTLDLYQRYHALIVGVEQYDHWPPRTNAVQDARDVSWELKRLGVSVELLTNPTKQQMQLALDEFAGQAGADADSGLIFYFAGNTHTAASTEGRTTGWIIPSDAPDPGQAWKDLDEYAISSTRIAALAGQIQSRHVLFVLDAPFSADLFQVEPPVLKVVNTQSALPVRQFITAGHGDDPIATESAFKRYLLKGLRGDADLIHDGVVSASELALFLSNRVPRVTNGKQRPQFGRITDTGDNGGEFIVQMTDHPLSIARLFVNAQPVPDTIRILNIKPRFRQGIELEPGRYHLEISADGFETAERWINLAAGEDRTETIKLSKRIKLDDAITNSLGMRFVRIRPGSFVMGSPTSEAGRSTDEIQHPVRLTQPYFMQSTEVTVGQFKQFVQSTGYKTEAEKGGGCWTAGDGRRWTRKPGTSWQKPGLVGIEDDLPAICVTWNDATAFARWLSRKERRTYRLPTEAEWEYAGRAGISTPFSTGRCLSTDEANYGKIGYAYQKCTTVFRKKRGRPIKVGLLPPNPWKLHNIHGNVSEWCQDWYGPYPSGNATNPKGPNSGSERVMRGGHWQTDAAGCRSARRWRFPPNLASDVVGFRLAMVP